MLLVILGSTKIACTLTALETTDLAMRQRLIFNRAIDDRN